MITQLGAQALGARHHREGRAYLPPLTTEATMAARIMYTHGFRTGHVRCTCIVDYNGNINLTENASI